MRNDENPVAQGNPDELFRDAPEQEIRCPHCGAIWERYIVTPDGSLYDWNTTDEKHAYSTHDRNHKPVCKDYCYACAYETAKVEDFKEFVDDTRSIDEFRAWRMGL